MTDNNAPPSKDPANEGTMQGVLTACMRKFLQGVDGQLPAVVIAYDRATNIATVKPLVQMLTTNGESVGRAQLANIPVVSLGGGQAAMHFKIMPGDLGWIEASDRDISIFKQNMAESSPNTVRLHSFSDGKFIPDQFGKYVLEDDASEFTLQTLDGTKRIEVFTDKIKLFTDEKTVVMKESDITITYGSSTFVMADATMTITYGSATAVMTSSAYTVTYGAVSMAVSSTGVAFTGGLITHNGKNIGDTHTHTGSLTAPLGPVSNTGVPV